VDPECIDREPPAGGRVKEPRHRRTLSPVLEVLEVDLETDKQNQQRTRERKLNEFVLTISLAVLDREETPPERDEHEDQADGKHIEHERCPPWQEAGDLTPIAHSGPHGIGMVARSEMGKLRDIVVGKRRYIMTRHPR
jgi:hypothetical protein